MENYAEGKWEVKTMAESDIEKDPELGTIQLEVLKAHNSAAALQKEEEVEFVKYDKVEFVRCCGMFYFLSIRVQHILSGKETILEKMVWTGTSLEVLKSKKTKKKIDIDPSSTTVHYGPFQFDFVRLVIRTVGPDTNTLELVHLYHFQENKDKGLDIPDIAGWFKFKVYDLTFQAKHFKSNNDKVVFQASVLHRNWLRILDDQTASSFRAWRIDISTALDPPNQRLREFERFKYYPIDLSSPELVTHAWLALQDHYYKKRQHLEFVKLVNAELSSSAGKYYFLTFQAKDQGILTTFQVVVYHIVFLKYWKPATLLKSCKMEDEYDVPEPWDKPSALYKPQRQIWKRSRTEEVDGRLFSFEDGR